MSRFKIGPRPEKNLEEPSYFFLKQEGDEICLMGEKEGYGEYYILTITSSGHILRHSSIDEILGLKLDKVGRVVID